VNVRFAAVGVAAVLLLTGCTNDPLAEQYADGSGQGYITADGAYTELPPEARDEAIVFDGVDENGASVSSDDFAGEVVVVNFWYASCPPCRVEAPDLAALDAEYDDVSFLGVNISDSEAVALTFADEFGIEYPSIMDARDSAVQLAFAGSVAPNAVPTTIVLDRDGRVAARISGLIRDQAILAAMIDTVLAEDQ
jgi:thiol-disulfide isomerase/thioredoxin